MNSILAVVCLLLFILMAVGAGFIMAWMERHEIPEIPNIEKKRSRPRLYKSNTPPRRIASFFRKKS